MPDLPALIFDFDGTLIESAPELAQCLNLLLAESGRAPLPVDEVEKMIGNGVAKLVERALWASGGVHGALEPHVERFAALYHDAPIEDTPLYDGVRETLDALSADGHVMAICTNKRYTLTMRILDGIGMAKYFRVVAGGDSYPVCKPDPGHLQGVLDGLGVTADRAIMIGDSVNDIGCARAAGVRSIAVTYGYSQVPHAELGADRLIDRFDALPAAIAELG